MMFKRASLLVLLCLSAAGCKTVQTAVERPFITGTETKYQSWTGDIIANGTGGSVETIEGVEYWRLGAPARPFRVVGLIMQTRADDALREAMFAGYSQRMVTELVKKNKGDGVLLLTNNRFGVDPAIDSRALAVFRYEGKRQ